MGAAAVETLSGEGIRADGSGARRLAGLSMLGAVQDDPTPIYHHLPLCPGVAVLRRVRFAVREPKELQAVAPLSLVPFLAASGTFCY